PRAQSAARSAHRLRLSQHQLLLPAAQRRLTGRHGSGEGEIGHQHHNGRGRVQKVHRAILSKKGKKVYAAEPDRDPNDTNAHLKSHNPQREYLEVSACVRVNASPPHSGTFLPARCFMYRVEDVVAEPRSSHSFDRVWIGSHAAFELVKFIFYRLLTTRAGRAHGVHPRTGLRGAQLHPHLVGDACDPELHDAAAAHPGRVVESGRHVRQAAVPEHGEGPVLVHVTTLEN
ncbi:hypothetical protein INR49_006359, partial [Caranx melampygus]